MNIFSRLMSTAQELGNHVSVSPTRRPVLRNLIFGVMNLNFFFFVPGLKVPRSRPSHFVHTLKCFSPTFIIRLFPLWKITPYSNCYLLLWSKNIFPSGFLCVLHLNPFVVLVFTRGEASIADVPCRRSSPLFFGLSDLCFLPRR